jgi:hypothetical protein
MANGSGRHVRFGDHALLLLMTGMGAKPNVGFRAATKLRLTAGPV